MVQDGVAALASGFRDLLDRIVNGIRGLPLVLAVGCQAGNDVSPTLPPPPHIAASETAIITAEPVEVTAILGFGIDTR